MSMSYLLFQGLEVLSENASNFEAVYKEFADQAEDIKGRLYAMLKKLNNEGPVNTEIHYLKARYLKAPSRLVLDISERVLDQILFNEKVCKYETKQLNRVIARTACEEHVLAIENLLKNKQIFVDAINSLKKEDEKDSKIVCRNFRQVGKHLCWSSRRLLANIRIQSQSSELFGNFFKAKQSPEWHHARACEVWLNALPTIDKTKFNSVIGVHKLLTYKDLDAKIQKTIVLLQKLKKYGSYKQVQDPSVLSVLDADYAEIFALEKKVISDTNKTLSQVGYSMSNVQQMQKKLQQLHNQMWDVRRNVIQFPDDDDLIWDHVTDDQEEWAEGLRQCIDGIIASANKSLYFWGTVVSLVKTSENN